MAESLMTSEQAGAGAGISETSSHLDAGFLERFSLLRITESDNESDALVAIAKRPKLIPKVPRGRRRNQPAQLSHLGFNFSKKTAIFESLPVEIQLQVLVCVPYSRKAFVELATVNKHFKKIIQCHGRWLCDKIFKRQFWQIRTLRGKLSRKPINSLLLDECQQEDAEIEKILANMLRLTDPLSKNRCNHGIIRAGLMLIMQRARMKKPSKRQSSRAEYDLFQISHRPSTDAAIRATFLTFINAAIRFLEGLRQHLDDGMFQDMMTVLTDPLASMALEDIVIDVSNVVLTQWFLGSCIAGDIVEDSNAADRLSETCNIIKSGIPAIQRENNAHRRLLSNLGSGQLDGRIHTDAAYHATLVGEFSGIAHSSAMARTIRMHKAIIARMAHAQVPGKFTTIAANESNDNKSALTLEQAYKKYKHVNDQQVQKRKLEREKVKQKQEREREREEALKNNTPAPDQGHNQVSDPFQPQQAAVRYHARHPFSFTRVMANPKEIKCLLGVESEEQVLKTGTEDYRWYLQRKKACRQGDDEQRRRFLLQGLTWSNDPVGIWVPSLD